MFITTTFNNRGYVYVGIPEKLDANCWDEKNILGLLKKLSEEDKDFFLAQLLVGDEKLFAIVFGLLPAVQHR